MKEEKVGLPTLASSVIWMISLGYLGVQIAFTCVSGMTFHLV